MEPERVTLHGHEIAYRTMGSGPVLMLLHGMAGSSATWRYVMPELARDFTVVAPDLLGHGDSAKPRSDYSLGALASGVRDLMIALGHDHATFIGQSYGGGVAMQFAYQYPERCDRLVLVGSGGLGSEVTSILKALTLPGGGFVLPLGATRGLRDFVAKVGGWFAKVGAAPSASALEMFRSYSALTDPETREAFMLTLRAVVDHRGQCVSARERLYLTRELPTQIIWGDADPIIPVQHGHDAHAAMPGSRLAIFPGVGHFPHCEAPRRFVEVVRAFITDTPSAKPISAQRWRELLTGIEV